MKFYLKYTRFQRFLFLNSNVFLLYYLLVAAGLVLIFGTSSYILSLAQPQLIEDFLKGSVWFYINLGGLIISLSATSIYGKKNIRTQQLLLPVSASARFFRLIIWCIPFYLIFILIFYTLLANGIEHIFASFHFIKQFSINIFHQSCKYYNVSFWEHIFSFILIQSAGIMLGSFFPRMGLIKSVGVLFILFILYVIIGALIPNSFIDSHFIKGFFSILESSDYHAEYLCQLMPITEIIWHLIEFLCIPLFWFITYLQLKGLEA